MSKEIIIKSVTTGFSTVFVTNDSTNVRDILTNPEVLDRFGVADADELLDNFVEFNDADVPEALANTMLGVVPANNDTIGVDVDGPEIDDEPSNTADSATGRGSVTIYTVGGMQTVLNFEGRMTVREAITSDAVQLRSRQSKAQLSACPVCLNGAPVEGAALDSRLITDGDVIVLSPARNAGDKGRN